MVFPYLPLHFLLFSLLCPSSSSHHRRLQIRFSERLSPSSSPSVSLFSHLPCVLGALQPKRQWPLSGKLLHISTKSYLVFQLSAWLSLLRKLPLTPRTRSGITSPHSHSILTCPSIDLGVDPTCL